MIIEKKINEAIEWGKQNPEMHFCMACENVSKEMSDMELMEFAKESNSSMILSSAIGAIEKKHRRTRRSLTYDEVIDCRKRLLSCVEDYIFNVGRLRKTEINLGKGIGE